jgi:hypothetical protein
MRPHLLHNDRAPLTVLLVIRSYRGEITIEELSSVNAEPEPKPMEVQDEVPRTQRSESGSKLGLGWAMRKVGNTLGRTISKVVSHQSHSIVF